jgi:hypothetical protein
MSFDIQLGVSLDGNRVAYDRQPRFWNDASSYPDVVAASLCCVGPSIAAATRG